MNALTRFRVPWIGLLFTAAAASAAPAGQLTTVAENSGLRETGRYAEVEALCREFASRYPKRARCFSIGSTPEGRTMWALAASNDGTLTPEQVQKRKRPVIVAQGGIHAGEIDGKDAGFIALRELLDDDARGTALNAVTFVFIPVFNVDGHERFGRWNRPNQIGPEEMGWRTTAQNFNLNRDYMKADTPEMQAMLGLLNAWDPVLYVDLHVTDGADFEHDISITTEPGGMADPELLSLAAEIRDRVIEHLARSGSLPLPYYPSFVVEDDPGSGFAVKPAQPRYSDGYWGWRNRVGMLVETHSWKNYAHRVRATLETLRGVLAAAARDAPRWRQIIHDVDKRESQLNGAPVPLAFENTQDVRIVEFRGYRYERTPSPISGALMTRYDSTRPELWRLPMRDRIRASLTMLSPGLGYAIPAVTAHWLVPKLALHGVRTGPLPDVKPESIHAWRADTVTLATESFEGHVETRLTGAWRPEARKLPEGAVFVPIAQPRARLIMALLEPEAPDSLAAWGFFPTAFERKEYMEPYVAEQVAREMMARDPGLAQAFQRRLEEDPAFAADPKARLDFFHRRHPSWDERYNLYPVLRLE
ncbi:MAG: M14 family metallopeptidase [Gammaproteobacteria bacterium]|nr:M14 family metallopeptidase [Gammaproteobacteria bacterium]